MIIKRHTNKLYRQKFPQVESLIQVTAAAPKSGPTADNEQAAAESRRRQAERNKK